MKKNFSILLIATVLAIGGCSTPGKRTGIGAGAGAGVGAAVGGAAGGWKGAGIGAVVGAATGAAVGNYLDKQYNELQEVADTKRVKDGILVNLKNDLLFDTGSSQIKPEAQSQLSDLGRILSKYKDDRIRIEGFTDNTGSASYNLELSKLRAQAVREVLKSQGVHDDQILVFGFGESRPIASNKTTLGRQQNRRVNLVIDVPKERQAAVESTEATGERLPASR